MAYAHYYGGLMHYRANRPDRMANHFDYFLKLAPEAPERPEVMQIMKTIAIRSARVMRIVVLLCQVGWFRIRAASSG